MNIKVKSCNDCAFGIEDDFSGKEYCALIYKLGENIFSPIPYDGKLYEKCPLKQGEVTIKLEQP